MVEAFLLEVGFGGCGVDMVGQGSCDLKKILRVGFPEDLEILCDLGEPGVEDHPGRTVSV